MEWNEDSKCLNNLNLFWSELDMEQVPFNALAKPSCYFCWSHWLYPVFPQSTNCAAGVAKVGNSNSAALIGNNHLHKLGAMAAPGQIPQKTFYCIWTELGNHHNIGNDSIHGVSGWCCGMLWILGRPVALWSFGNKTYVQSIENHFWRVLHLFSDSSTVANHAYFWDYRGIHLARRTFPGRDWRWFALVWWPYRR